MTNIKAVATGVLSTGHFPAHLGLNTDAEKIEWLARELEKLADASDYRDDVLDCEICDMCEIHGSAV